MAIDRKKVGKNKRAEGKAFEILVRNDLESLGYVVDRWTNNVDLKQGKVVAAKPKMVFNPILKRMIHQTVQSGFPDLVYWERLREEQPVYAVECKINGKLDREEKDKIKWLLKNKIFTKIFIAEKTKVKNKIRIVYRELELAEDE